MGDTSKLEIECEQCGADALVVREPIYDGFSRIGESLRCSNCGYEYACEDDLPFKTVEKEIKIFDDADRSEKVSVFREDEKHAVCRYCRHYVVNPFTQWCGMHKKEVEATDACDCFERQLESEEV